jgi:hypothetical protein
MDESQGMEEELWGPSAPSGGKLKEKAEPIIIHKNRKRAFWSLIIVLFFVPISGWLVFLGLQPGRSDVSWSMVLFGILGVVTFCGSAILIVRTMRAPWHIALTPSHFNLYSPTYDLEVPWDNIAGIAVDEVSRREGCVLVFEDVAEVAQGATFHLRSKRPDAITDAAAMQAQMGENLKMWGYHFGIPGRMLEMGPEELAQLLTQARTGQLWQAKEMHR